MPEEEFDILLNLGIPAFFIALSFFVGRWIERRHYRSIEERESLLRDVILVSSKNAPEMDSPPRTTLVTGSMVVSSNSFLNLLYALQSLFGGTSSAYESLLDRARREAVLRMKQRAKNMGAIMIVNVWMEGSRIGTGKRTNGMCEVLAYGTAIIPS